jgi:DNA-binding response OmpR family regulator
MTRSYSNKRILVIDHQPNWRELSTYALREAGFSVQDCENYSSPSLQNDDSDLIILGCAQVGPEEQRLIAQLLKDKHHILVLSAYLPKSIMRSLYMQGVDDIVDKPYSPATLVNIVQQLSDNIALHQDANLLEEERASIW